MDRTLSWFKKKIVDFLTSTLLRTQKTTLLSKVRRRFFSNFVAFQKTQTLNHKVKIRYQNKMFSFISHALNYIGTTCGQIHFRGWFVNRIYDQLFYFVKTFDATMGSKIILEKHLNLTLYAFSNTMFTQFYVCFFLKPNYFKKHHFLSSFLLT